MTIHVPRPVAIVLGLLLAAGLLTIVVREAPDLVRYAKFEGM